MPNPIIQTKAIIIGLVVLCTLLLGSSIYFATRSNNPAIDSQKISKSSINISTESVNTESLTPSKIPYGYPQKLFSLKRSSNEGVTFNLAQKSDIPFEQKQNNSKVTTIPTNTPNGYFSRVTNIFGRISDENKYVFTNYPSYPAQFTTIANSFILTRIRNIDTSKLVPDITISHIYRNPNYDDKNNNKYKESITTTGDIFQSIGIDSKYNVDNLVQENVVWFGSSNLPVDKRTNSHRHGVAIYNRNLNEKGLMGTYLRDYDAEIDTKISNQVCINITFTQDNFICLNDYEILVNLNTGEEFGKYNQFIDTNDGYLYAKDVDNTMIYKVELNNPKNATKIYNVTDNETISHFSFTSQKELLVQVTTSTPQSGILPPKITARTIELKNDGSILERPEFKDVRIFI